MRAVSGEFHIIFIILHAKLNKRTLSWHNKKMYSRR